MCDSCEKTEFGCCIDLENAAYGPDFEGCPDEDGSGGGFQDCAVSVSKTKIALSSLVLFLLLIKTVPLYRCILYLFLYRNMAVVQMVLLRQEDQIIKAVKMLLLAKMLLGDVVLIWFTQHMVLVRKVAAFPRNLDVAQII